MNDSVYLGKQGGSYFMFCVYHGAFYLASVGLSLIIAFRFLKYKGTFYLSILYALSSIALICGSLYIFNNLTNDYFAMLYYIPKWPESVVLTLYIMVCLWGTLSSFIPYDIKVIPPDHRPYLILDNRVLIIYFLPALMVHVYSVVSGIAGYLGYDFVIEKTPYIDCLVPLGLFIFFIQTTAQQRDNAYEFSTKPNYKWPFTIMACVIIIGVFIQSAIFFTFKYLMPYNYSFLADHYQISQKLKEATFLYKKAIEINKCFSKAYFQLGQIMADSNQLTDALRYYQTVIDLNPDDPNGHFQAAMIYEQIGNEGSAIKHYSEALYIQPDFVHAHVQLANLYVKRDHLKDAIRHYKRAVHIEPNNKELESLLHIAEKNALINDAIQILSEKIKHNPNDMRLREQLGSAYLSRGKVDIAIDHFFRCLQSNENSPLINYKLGIAYLNKNQLSAAIAHLSKAVQLAPDMNEAKSLLQKAIKKETAKNMINQYADMLTDQPDDVNMLWDIANAYVDLENYSQAQIYYKKILQLNPDHWNAHYQLGRLMIPIDIDQAIDHLNTAIKIQPDQLKIHKDLGDSWLRKGDFQKAINNYLIYLKTDAENADVLNAIGTAWYKSGKIDDAVLYFSKASENKPDSATIHNHLGMALFQKGRTKDAIAHYHKALQLHPDHPEVLNNLGAALYQQDDIESAIEHFQLAVKVSPFYEDAQKNLETAERAWMIECDQKIIDLKTQLSQQNNNSDLHDQLGELYLKKQSPVEAIKYFKEALRLQPDRSKTLSHLADAYSLNNEFSNAIDTYLLLLNQLPNYAGSISYNIACMYARQNNADQAIEWLNKVMAKGMKNINYIQQDKDFDLIRQSNEYISFIKQYHESEQ